MGSLFRPPPPVSVPLPVAAAPPPSPPSVPAAEPAVSAEDVERRRRLDALARRQRGLAGTMATSPRGLLLLSDNTLQRKSLLGE